MLLHVGLPHHFSEGAIHRAHGATPEGPLRFRTSERFAVEREVLRIKRWSEHACAGIEHHPAQVGFPVLQGRDHDEIVDGLEITRHHEHERLEVLQPPRSEVAVPVKIRHHPGQGLHGHLVVIRRPIPGGFLGDMGLSKARFQGQDRRRRSVTLRQLSKLKHLGDVRLIGRPQLLAPRIVFQIILPLRKAKARLPAIDHIAGRVLEIRHLAHANGHFIAPAIGLGEVGAKVGVGSQRVDARKFRRQGRHAPLLSPLKIHIGCEKIADLLLIAPFRMPPSGRLLDDLPHVLLGLISQDTEAPVAALVGGNLRLRQPAAVDITKEVLAGAHGGIHIGLVDAGAQGRHRGRWRRGVPAAPKGGGQDTKREDFTHGILSSWAPADAPAT